MIEHLSLGIKAPVSGCGGVDLVAFFRVYRNCISVKDAADYSGYSTQYLRRLLQLGKLTGLKLGQLWLIEMESFEAYLLQAGNSVDYRFGPKQSLKRGENK